MLVLAPGAAANPPDVSLSIFGTLGANGWYRSNVTLNWTVAGAQNSTGCDAVTLGGDTLGTRFTCSAENNGDITTKTVTIKLDKTAPVVTASAERAPNGSGWYNAPVTVSFSGTDATSQIASCTSARYAGPDNPAVAVAGSCTDNAGNVTGASLPLKYDATAPSFSLVSAKHGNRSVLLAWKASADTKQVQITRSPGRDGAPDAVVYQGSAATYRDTGLAVGRNYQYQVSGFDEALNRVDRTILFTASGALLSPLPGERVTKPPTLSWTRVRGASYYNIQLIRGRRVLSAWPMGTSFKVPRAWVYRGRRYRLRPGTYRWYVWPGYGRISASRYAPRPLGSSTFVMSR